MNAISSIVYADRAAVRVRACCARVLQANTVQAGQPQQVGLLGLGDAATVTYVRHFPPCKPQKGIRAIRSQVAALRL